MSHSNETRRPTGRRPGWVPIVLGSAAIVALVATLAALLGRPGPGRDAGAIAGAIAGGRLDEAQRAADAWLDRRPDDPEALAWAARVAIARDQPAEALEFARRAQQRGLDRAAIRDVEGVLLARAGRLAEAEPLLRAHLAEVERPDPVASRAMAKLGMATFRFGLAREALARWRRDAPDDPEPWLLEAEVADRVGNDADVVAAHYREALRLDPDHDRARLGLARALRDAGRHDEAAEAFDVYLRRRPDDPEALAAAGQNDLSRGDLDAAERRLSRALEHDPGRIDALKGMASVAQLAGRVEEALDLIGRAAEAEPEDPEIAYQQSLLLARLGRRDEAERMLERSERLRDEADEIARLRDALVRDPGNVALQYEAARWLIDHGHAEEGIRWAEKALEARPGHRPTCLLLAEHYESTGQPDLAGFYRWQAGPAVEESARP